jgi:lipopolysaccharide/colanic/teichoic acid biosynthesis glycosyltransferase
MEVLTLPFTSNKAKTYKHYSLHATPAADNLSIASKTEFYYIGNNASRIDKLIRIFESGYATESCLNAKAMLIRLQNHSHALPYIIICDSQLGYDAIREFRCFLNSQKDLGTVPFVLDDQGMTKEQRLQFRKEKIVDEILCVEEFTKERLLAKAKFLNKTKSNISIEGWQKKIETSTTSVCNQRSYSKRGFDILFASVLLILLSPVFLLIALAIKLESKGPVLYIAKRAGRGYKIFNFYKFRTMVMGADSKINDYSHLNQYNSTTTAGPKFYKIQDDPRITKVGAMLRKTSLDELPQLINVLLGDMSLVGNRPLPLYEAATLTTDEWAKRFLAPAGITGLWQIKKRGNKDMSVEERINLDIYYANKYNFAYDLWIMANTPTALIQKTNA